MDKYGDLAYLRDHFHRIYSVITVCELKDSSSHSAPGKSLYFSLYVSKFQSTINSPIAHDQNNRVAFSKHNNPGIHELAVTLHRNGSEEDSRCILAVQQGFWPITIPIEIFCKLSNSCKF